MSFGLGGLLLAFAVQAPQASVVGVVREAGTGNPVPGVEVVLTDLGRTVGTNGSEIDVRPRVTLGSRETRGRSAQLDRTVSASGIRSHPMLAEPDAFQAP